MYEIFESQVDNIEISREYNYLRNYKIEEINGGGVLADIGDISRVFFSYNNG